MLQMARVRLTMPYTPEYTFDFLCSWLSCENKAFIANGPINLIDFVLNHVEHKNFYLCIWLDFTRKKTSKLSRCYV